MSPRLPGPRSPAWVMAESLASSGFSLISMLLIGRVIGPEAAGVGTVAIAAFLLLDVLAAALFTDSLVQHPALAPRHARSAVTAAVLTGLGTALLLAAAAPFLADHAGMPAVTALVLVLAPLLPLSAFSGVAAGLILRERRFRLLALRVLLGQPLALGAGLAAAQAGLGPWAMVANQVVATVVTFLLVLGFGRLSLRPLLEIGALRDLWPVAGPQIAAVVVMVGKYRIFLIALGFTVSEAVVALSHFAFRMLDAVLMVVWQSASRLALPRLCALQHDREALAEAYGEIAQLQALIGLPLSLGVALTAPDLVAALLGPAWAGTAEATTIAGLVAAITFLQGDYISLFVAVGKARHNLYIALATLAVPLTALVLMRPETPAGVAFAWASQCAALPPVLTWMVLRELRRSPLWLARQVAPAVVAAAAMSGAVLLVQHALLDTLPLLRLAAASAAGAVVFVLVGWLALGARLPAALTRASAAPAPAE